MSCSCAALAHWESGGAERVITDQPVIRIRMWGWVVHQLVIPSGFVS